jgi:hypothetical protein
MTGQRAISLSDKRFSPASFGQISLLLGQKYLPVFVSTGLLSYLFPNYIARLGRREA